MYQIDQVINKIKQIEMTQVEILGVNKINQKEYQFVCKTNCDSMKIEITLNIDDL
jgi:hypothetical protein